MSEKKKVGSFSGGRTSAYMALRLREEFGPDVQFIFMDTGAEHPATYEFVRNCVKHFNLNLVCLRTDFRPALGNGNGYQVVPLEEVGHDLVPYREMMAKYGTPYIGGAFCTDRMKNVPFTKYCNDTFGKGGYETWLGIRADEPSRLPPVVRVKPGIRYLAEIDDAEKQDILDWWKGQPFDLGIATGGVRRL